jgi:riboflavin synthase
MFTGIIEKLGKVKKAVAAKSGLVVETSFPNLRAGESVAVNGVCLTVSRVKKNLASFDPSPETMRKTALGKLKTGQDVNLERALRLGDRIGGHFVSGHVDGKGRITALRPTGAGKEMTVIFPSELKKYLAVKGSIAVDGVSLTIARLSGNRFSTALIPYTLSQTNLRKKRVGEEVNLEVDMIARYLKNSEQ